MPSENTRRIAYNTVMLYSRMLLIMGVTLYTSRVVLNTLGVEDYGIYNVVGGVVVMFSFLNVAMAVATQRFLSFEIGRGDFEQLRKVFCLSVNIHWGIAVLILLLSETIGLWFLNTQMNIPASRMDAARWIYQFSIFSFIVSVIQVPYNSSIIARERMHVYAFISIIEVCLKLLIVFMLTWIGYDKLKLYAVLIFGVTVVVALFYRIYCSMKLPECNYKLYWDRQLYMTLTGFAGWSMFGSIAWLTRSQGINIVLNLFLGPMVNAAYGVANQVNVAVNSFVQNFSTALNPQIVKSYASGNIDYLIQLLFRGTKLSYCLLLVLAVPLLLETEFILKIWLKVIPEHAVVFTRLMIINSLLESYAFTIGASIQATGRIKWYQIIVGGTILLNIPLAWLFLKFGYPPAVVLIISVIISVVTLGQRLLIVWYYFRFSFWQFVMQVFVRTGFATLSACVFPLLCGYYFLEGWTRLGVVVVVSVFCTLLSTILIVLDTRERAFLFHWIRKYLKTSKD